MSLGTLVESQREAAELLNIPFAEVEAAQTTTVHYLGKIAIGDRTFDAYRAHSGAEGKIAKGGIRIANYPTEQSAQDVVEELATEMLWKMPLRNHHEEFRGGKGLVNAKASDFTHEERQAVSRQFEELMEASGFASHKKDIPAGDVGTNGLSDTYALHHHELHPEDKYWRAVITGKSPENGGLAFRTQATGWGTYVAHRRLLDHQEREWATATVQGFGNVGSWYTYFAANDPAQRVSIMAISEVDGVLSTSDPRGLPITLEMVQKIGDNPKFEGSKIDALAQMIKAEYPDIALEIAGNPNAILEIPTDDFVPAAMGNVITEHNVDKLGVRYNIIEAANGPTTLAADRLLRAKGITVLPDILTNSGGVDCSITELKANIDMADAKISVMPDDAEVQRRMTESTTCLVDDVIAMSRKMNAPSLRVATVGLGMARLLGKKELLPA